MSRSTQEHEHNRHNYFHLPGYHRLWLSFPAYSVNNAFCNYLTIKISSCLTTPLASRYARCLLGYREKVIGYSKRKFNFFTIPYSLSPNTLSITCNVMRTVWASPLSLAATYGILISLFSSRY